MEQICGLDELNRRVLERGLCAACGACVGRCPYLISFKGKTVMLDRCTVEHGRCFAYCPMTFFDPDAASRIIFGSPYEDRTIGHARDIKAARATDPAIASAGQGGGTVTSMMISALSTGMIDAAVLTGCPAGEMFARGIVATAAREIVSCCGSRFVGSHSLAALREALDRGHSRIGVVGLPCQVRSLRKMALYDIMNEGLKDRVSLVVGLFCNWAFSPRQFTGFLADEFDLQNIRKCNIPPPPADVLEVETDTGLLRVPLERLRPMIQAACNECPDMTSEFADVSVGMYEGKPGWNTVITRTDAGERLFRRAVEENRLEVEAFPEANLEHLRAASDHKRKRGVAGSSRDKHDTQR